MLLIVKNYYLVIWHYVGGIKNVIVDFVNFSNNFNFNPNSISNTTLNQIKETNFKEFSEKEIYYNFGLAYKDRINRRTKQFEIICSLKLKLNEVSSGKEILSKEIKNANLEIQHSKRDLLDLKNRLATIGHLSEKSLIGCIIQYQKEIYED
ncbi:hypothetical protein ACTFIU_011137 [Dictyostelium citrinum]